VADFIIDHNVELDDACTVTICPWRLFFNGSICTKGNRIGCVMISPHGVRREVSARLEFKCMNNQAEYEALAFGQA
jgi:hypothetical protein